jgi:osmoprotectant transport system substrate-binding protein
VTSPDEDAPKATVVAASKAVKDTGNTLALIPLPSATTNPLLPATSSPAPTPRSLQDIESFALNATNANDRQVIVMTAARSQETAVRSLDFASPQCGSLDVAVSAPLATASELKKSLASKYSCRVENVNALESRRQLLSALLTDQVQLAVLPQTDPSIYDNGLVALEDPRNLFPNELVTPYLSGDLQNTEVAAIANRVSEKITENTMAELTRATTGDGALSAREAAREWLIDQGLMTQEQK